VGVSGWFSGSEEVGPGSGTLNSKAPPVPRIDAQNPAGSRSGAAEETSCWLPDVMTSAVVFTPLPRKESTQLGGLQDKNLEFSLGFRAPRLWAQ